MQQCSTSYTEMKTTLVVSIFLLTNIVWTVTSTVIHAKEELSPRAVIRESRAVPFITCPTSFAPYCTCDEYGSGRDLTCIVSKNEDFDGIRSLLSADSYIDYERVTFRMTSTLDIPADVLGGKRAQWLDLRYPDRSTPSGQIDVDAFRSTSDNTTNVDFYRCNLTDFRFDFLAQFTALETLAIYDSSLKTINDMPSLPTLNSFFIQGTTDFESWYSPSTTPNLESIYVINNPDLNDEKLDSILSSMTENFIYPKLTHLSLNYNALTRVPPIGFSFPALNSLYLQNNPIVTLKTGSVNNPNDNLRSLYLFHTNLTTVEPGAFVGNFSSTRIYLGNNPAMTTFPSSSFQYLLESMVGHSGHVSIIDNPISDDCGLAWLIRDNRELLRYVRGGAIANGTAFKDLNPGGYSNCF